MTGSSKPVSQTQLIDEIEAFSRNGSPVRDEESDKPVFTRDRLSFPDLTQPPPAQQKIVVSSIAERNSSPAQAHPEHTAGTLLDRLKQQAQTVHHSAARREAEGELRAFRLSASIGAAFYYLNDLVKQLNIIKPEMKKEFVFAGNIVFSGMSWVEGAADFRMLPTASEDRLFETMTLRFRISAARQITVERDALGVEPLRKMLYDANIGFQLEERKNNRNLTESGIFTIPSEIKAGFLIKADYEANDLMLRTRNIDRFGMMEFRLQAGDLAQSVLDELAQLMLGHENRFLKLFRRSA